MTNRTTVCSSPSQPAHTEYSPPWQCFSGRAERAGPTGVSSQTYTPHSGFTCQNREGDAVCISSLIILRHAHSRLRVTTLERDPMKGAGMMVIHRGDEKGSPFTPPIKINPVCVKNLTVKVGKPIKL